MQVGLNLSDSAGQLLQALEQRAENLQPALRDMADLLRTRERKVFASDGAAAGVSWPELSARTVSRKSGGSTLIDRGVLYRSLTQRSARYSVYTVNRDNLLYGTKDPVANLLRRGTKRMPARHPVPPVTVAERNALANSLLAFLLQDRS